MLAEIELWMILVTQGVSLCGSVLSIWLTLKNKAAIREVHLSINSRMDQLVIASRAEGKLDGIESKGARQ